MRIKRLVVVSFAAALLATGVAGGPASAVEQDGLVNVNIGDVTVTDTVDAAVLLVLQACPNIALEVDVAAIIAAINDGTTKQATFCKIETGKVKVTQN